jgi:hypothetical protein
MRTVTSLVAMVFAAQIASAKYPQPIVGHGYTHTDMFNGEQLQKEIAAAQEAQLPYKGRVMELLIGTQLKALGDPDSAAQMAHYIHNLYENLIKEGFSKDEALQIAARVPLPPTPGGPIE